jgi:hypothetical protein
MLWAPQETKSPAKNWRKGTPGSITFKDEGLELATQTPPVSNCDRKYHFTFFSSLLTDFVVPKQHILPHLLIYGFLKVDN